MDVEQNYNTIVEVIKKYGKPNPQYPTDLDLDYGTISKHTQKMGGLVTVLKNMKKKKMVDFGDNGFFKDNSIITLIQDPNAEANSLQLTANQIKGTQTSHEKAIQS
eukprot:TRINITY_DN22100_c0_g1_i1.p1 TRINITY_DN22100_c0_g1~~TRINITY_DN22100_c0_g1_i1.p1  ORF type:complete len:114 (+),score=26.60 TRINITY_DN22100_c0_g1_i1:26-343(+)